MAEIDGDFEPYLEASRGQCLSPYLLWPDRAGSHLFNDQGTLQLGAECGAVVPALALRGSPAKKKTGLVFSGVPGGRYWGALGKSRVCTCRATSKGGAVHSAAPP